MLNSLKNIIKQLKNDTEETDSEGELNLLCGLMLEAAQIDGKVDQIEVDKISKILIEIFEEDQLQVEFELKKSLKKIDEPKSLHFYTSKLNKKFSNKKKELLIVSLWEIFLLDG